MRKDPPALVSAAWTSDIETFRVWAPPQFQIGDISSAKEYQLAAYTPLPLRSY